MSIFIEKDGKKTLPRSFYFKILAFFGLIGITVIGMMPLQAALNHGMLYVRDNFVVKIEEFTGLKVHYSSIRPVLFGSFDIRNLRLEKDEKQFLTVSRVKIKYSIWDLLRNKKTFIRTVIIDNPVLEIDAQKDNDTFELLSSIIKKRQKENLSEIDGERISLSDFLPNHADYQIHNGYFSLIDNGTEYQIENLQLVIKEEEKNILLDGSFSAVYKYVSPFDKNILLKTDVSLNGLCASDFESGNADINFLYTVCSQQNTIRKNSSFFRPAVNSIEKPQMIFSVSSFGIKLAFEDRLLKARQLQEDSISNYYLQYDMDTGNVSAELNLNSYQLDEKINFSNSMEKIKHLLLGIDGNASFKKENKDSFFYNVNLKSGNLNKAVTNPLTDAFFINASGDNKKLNVRNFLLSSSASSGKENLFRGKIEFSGDIEFDTLKSNGELNLQNINTGGNADLNAYFDISTSNNEVKITSDTISISDTEIYDFNILIHPSDKDIVFTFSCFGADNGEIYMDAIYNRNPNQLEASFSFNTLSFYELSEFIRPFSDKLAVPAIGRNNLKKSYIAADIFIQTDFNNIIYNAPNIAFNIGETNGLLSVSGTDHQMNLGEGIIFINDDELLISSNVNFTNPMNLLFNLKASYMDLSWNVEGQLLDRTTLIVRDPNGLNIYGNLSGMGELSGYMEGINYPFFANNQKIYLNFYGTMRYISADFWNLDINRFAVNINNLNGEKEIFRISGIADQKGASIREIIYSDTTGVLAGNADFWWKPGFSNMEFLINISDGHEIGEHYYLEGALNDDQIKVNASVSDLHLNRFLKRSNPLLISADFNVLWNSIDSFNASINVKSFYTKVRGETLLASVGINFNNDELLINNLRFNLAGVKGIMPELVINRAEGIAAARVDISGNAVERVIDTKISFNFNFEESNSWLDIPNAFENFDGKLVIGDIIYGDLKPEDFVFNFAGKEGALSVSGGIRDMFRLEMENDGAFYAGFSAPMFARGTLVGTFNKGIIDAYTNNFYFDLSSLYSLISRTDVFYITGGYITGNMEFRGPIINPEFHGSGIASSMRFQVPGYVGDDLCPVPFLVQAEGHEITFGPVVTAIGSGNGDVSGWILLENWRPVSIGLDASIPRNKPIPYDLKIVGILANGNASGNLTFLFDFEELFIEMKGNVFTNDAVLGMSVEDLTSSSDKDDEDGFNVIVDFTITAGSMVEFIWPVTTPIIRANPELGTVMYITNDSRAGQYSINSEIKIRSGELYHLDRSFFIRQGSIVFKENETKFNPILNARADIRDRVDSGPVTISMIINNQSLFSFMPRFESSPALTQLEIYSLLGQNFNSAQGEDNTDQSQRVLLASTTDLLTQLVASSEVFSQFAFFRQFERQVRDVLGFDMFSVRTKLFHNWVVSGATDLGQQTPVDRGTRVGNYFDNTSVFIGKYIGQHMFVHLQGVLKYDENSNVLGGVKFEPDIGIELDSPFVNIRWDFFPYHPQNWWVNDNSITLSWSFSF